MRPPEPKFGADHLERYGPDIHPCMLWWDTNEPEPLNQPSYLTAFYMRPAFGVRGWPQMHTETSTPDLGITKEQRADFRKELGLYPYPYCARRPLEVRMGPTLEEMTSVKK